MNRTKVKENEVKLKERDAELARMAEERKVEITCVLDIDICRLWKIVLQREQRRDAATFSRG